MRMGKTGFVALAVFAIMTLGAAACSSDDGASAPKLSQPEQTGRELTTKFITLIAKKDITGLEGFLSDAFTLQRANGTFADKASYLKNPAVINEFEITNVTAKVAGSALVVRWDLIVNEIINGQAYKGQPAPRLSTFLWNDGNWQIVSHANFNVPVQ